MRAIRINAKDRLIEVVEWETLRDLQRHVGGLIERVELEGLDRYSLLVDEEGLCKELDYGFVIKGYPNPIMGNGLFVGDNCENFVGTDIYDSLIKRMVTWILRPSLDSDQ